MSSVFLQFPKSYIAFPFWFTYHTHSHILQVLLGCFICFKSSVNCNSLESSHHRLVTPPSDLSYWSFNPLMQSLSLFFLFYLPWMPFFRVFKNFIYVKISHLKIIWKTHHFLLRGLCVISEEKRYDQVYDKDSNDLSQRTLFHWDTGVYFRPGLVWRLCSSVNWCWVKGCIWLWGNNGSLMPAWHVQAVKTAAFTKSRRLERG